MTTVLALYGPTEGVDRARCRAAARFLERRESISAGKFPAGRPAAPASTQPPDEAAAEALRKLARDGRLSFEVQDDDVVEAWYTPSRRSLESIADDGAGSGFPAAVHKKQQKVLRTSRGALFVFPAEEGDERLEVFITDWSPCPVACAVALHADHPFLADREVGRAPMFSGRFVRHPLTGDLLPVWIADWVKPHFGTGAVLINPAHDATDLDFARRTGLPIRFGLAPEGFDGSPDSWLEPPIVKAGRSIRSGPYDGLAVAEANDRYFEVLEERGLARRHTDLQAGRWRLAVLRVRGDDTGGLLTWDHRLRRLGSGDEGGRSVEMEIDETLAAAIASRSGDGRHVVVAPAGERDDALLALRLLAFDLAGEPLVPADVQLVQRAQGVADELDEDVRDVGLVIGAPLDQVVSIKQQVVDQVAKFLKVHGEVAAKGGAGDAGDAPSKQVLEAKRAIETGDTARAFAAAYKLQKQLADVGGSDREAYFALAWVLASLEPPPGADPVAAWERSVPVP